MSHGSNSSNIGLWAMAQTPILLAFEPWLKPINYWTLSHGSNPQKTGLWAMAQTHQLLNFEPWLKPPKNGPLSHGSNPHLTCRFSHALFYMTTYSSSSCCSLYVCILRGKMKVHPENLYNMLSLLIFRATLISNLWNYPFRGAKRPLSLMWYWQNCAINRVTCYTVAAAAVVNSTLYI